MKKPKTKQEINSLNLSKWIEKALIVESKINCNWKNQEKDLSPCYTSVGGVAED